MKALFFILFSFFCLTSCKKKEIPTAENAVIISERLSYKNDGQQFVLKSGKFENSFISSKLGFKKFNLGPEPEFFLFKLDENQEPTLEVNDKGGYFDLAPTDLAGNTRREIVNVLTDLGFEVEASHHEVAVGQHEIDFKYEDVLKACVYIQ